MDLRLRCKNGFLLCGDNKTRYLWTTIALHRVPFAVIRAGPEVLSLKKINLRGCLTLHKFLLLFAWCYVFKTRI